MCSKAGIGAASRAAVELAEVRARKGFMDWCSAILCGVVRLIGGGRGGGRGKQERPSPKNNQTVETQTEV